MKKKTFEEFLRNEHAKTYTGFDDDMSDAFEHWLSNQDGNDIIAFAEKALAEVNNIDRPEYGKQYLLMGATGTKAISNGSSWAESEVKKSDKTFRINDKAFVQEITHEDKEREYRVIERGTGKIILITDDSTLAWKEAKALGSKVPDNTLGKLAQISGRIDKYVEIVRQLNINLSGRKITTISYGKRYAKIVCGYPDDSAARGSRSVHSFIDLRNGDILKAASWKAPAKHARGSVFDADNGRSAIEWTGAKYLRG